MGWTLQEQPVITVHVSNLLSGFPHHLVRCLLPIHCESELSSGHRVH